MIIKMGRNDFVQKLFPLNKGFRMKKHYETSNGFWRERMVNLMCEKIIASQQDFHSSDRKFFMAMKKKMHKKVTGL